MNKQFILGISAYYHDSAAALINSGSILAAAQEERFSRKKHDPCFPSQAIQFCLDQAGITLQDLDSIVFYDKPFLTFDRILETYLSFAPKGMGSFINNMPIWVKEKLNLKSQLKKSLANLANIKTSQLPPLLFTEHHQSHAASAFYPSPYDEAAILCLDGVGEWASTSAWHGKGNQLDPLWQINFPHSLGLLYSAFTAYCGFKVNSGEYKLMGLAPYGKPIYADLIKKHLIDIQSDGSFKLDLSYFEFCTGDKMTSEKFHGLFGSPARQAEDDITERTVDLAASIQAVTEDVVIALASTLKQQTNANSLCLAGGVALNCTANRVLVESGIFDNIWVQPAAGDAGGALGAAMAAWHHYHQQPRHIDNPPVDKMLGSYLGPEYSETEIELWLKQNNIPYQKLSNSELDQQCAERLSNGNIVGWFQGRMEFGPRALGHRSILADPRNKEMQLKLNQKIKFRESFRPFAPAVLAEKKDAYFDSEHATPYMTFTAPITKAIQYSQSAEAMNNKLFMDKLYVARSSLPAVTHVDYSARLQTVDGQYNSRFHQLLTAFEQRTGCASLINTSFNVRGEPIVCTPQDAYHCFMATEMDFLALQNFLISKDSLPPMFDTNRHFETD